MADFSFVDLVTGYESTEVGGVRGKSFFVRRISGSVGVSRFRFVAAVERFCAKLSRLVSYTSARAWGLFLLGFGLLTLLFHFAMDYMGIYEDVPMAVLILGTVLSIVSVPLLATDMQIAAAFQEFSLTDYIFFEFFCIKRVNRDDSERGIHPALMLVLGMLSAVLGVFVSPLYVAGGITALIYVYLTFVSPEFSFLLIFLIMPYLSLIPMHGALVAVLVAVTLLSFVRKVMQGKRVYCFEQYDVALFLMLVFVLISGIFVKGVESFGNSVTMILLAFGYVLSGNLVINRRLADCAIHAVVISSVPVSVMAIAQFTSAWVAGGVFPSVGATATFGDSSVLAVFLLVALAFSSYFAVNARGVGDKILYFTILTVTVTALATTLMIWVAVSVLFGLAALRAVRMKRVSGFLLGVLGFVLYAVLFVPYDALVRISSLPIVSKLGLAELAARWRISLSMFADNVFTGVGMGADSYYKEYLQYSETAAATDSGNFLLEIGVEAGVFALILFAVILIIQLVHRTRYRRYVMNSHVMGVSNVTAAVIVSLSVFGVFNYVWADMTMYYLFWCVFGLGSASLRISKREFDDRVGYFSDGRSVSSSAVDIGLK